MGVSYRIAQPRAKVFVCDNVTWRRLRDGGCLTGRAVLVSCVIGGNGMRKALSFILLASLGAVAYAQHQHAVPEKLGEVSFPVTCATQVQDSFNRAVALLHSFTYEPAVAAFQDVAVKDPKCAM